MTGFSGLRPRLTTPDDTDDTAGVDSTIRHRPDAVGRAVSEADAVEPGRFARAEGMPLPLHATGWRTTAPSGPWAPHQPGPPDRLLPPARPPPPPLCPINTTHLRTR